MSKPTPFVSSLPSTPIRVFPVESCTAGKLPVEESVHDPVAGLHILNQVQERRKRVLGWRRTHKDPFEGEWEQIMAPLVSLASSLKVHKKPLAR